MLSFALVTKSEAIESLLNCKWLDDACKNINRIEWEELRQRFWITALQQKEDTFEKVRDLQFYCVRMIINENLKIKKEGIRHALDTPDVAEDVPHEEPEQEIHSAIESKDEALGRLPMYERVIYKLHEKGVSQRAISSYTKIGRNEINKTINRVKKYITANVSYERASD